MRVRLWSCSPAGSSGLGLAMARQLVAGGHRVVSLALGRSDDLPADVEQWEVDLSDPVPVAHRLREWLGGLAPADIASATLISTGLDQLARGVALEEAAARVLAYLARPDFGEHPVADVREA